MTRESDAKFEEKLTCGLEMRNMRNLVEFHQSTRKSQKWDAKFEEKLTCGLENNMNNLANFYQSTRKSQNWDFDGILLLKVENI